MNDTILSNITTNHVRKRLSKELAHISQNNLYIVNGDKETINVTILDTNNFYTFNITNNYPFHIPKIKINNSDYINFLRIPSLRFQQLLIKITGLNCLCCNSYICNGRWTPSMTLQHIIDEIKYFNKYKKNIINKFYADKIINKYLISDINLDIWFF